MLVVKEWRWKTAGEALTFTVRHAEAIENLDVIYSNVAPALSLYQPLNHHLLQTQKDLQLMLLFHLGATYIQ